MVINVAILLNNTIIINSLSVNTIYVPNTKADNTFIINEIT